MKLLSFFAGLWNFYGARARRRPYFVGDRRSREIVKFFAGLWNFYGALARRRQQFGGDGRFREVVKKSLAGRRKIL